ncbi:MAG: tryptophan-rich sensory protein [Clostridia bacterium]|nr:tryptophan-rich sensory protein [Clostridia bacterium]
MKNFLKSAFIVAIPILVGALSGFLIRNNVYIYDVLIKPPYALPANLFSVVWGILYLLMGVSLLFYLKSDYSPDGVTLFAFQLLLNFFWSIVFFNFRAFLAAFILLVVLFVFVALTVSTFYKTQKISGILLIPYLLFLIYAGYLNFGVWFLNM